MFSQGNRYPLYHIALDCLAFLWVTHTFRVAHKSHCDACERASEQGEKKGFTLLVRSKRQKKEGGACGGVGAKACMTAQPNTERRWYTCICTINSNARNFPACSLVKASKSVMINHLSERGSNFSINVQIEVFFLC